MKIHRLLPAFAAAMFLVGTAQAEEPGTITMPVLRADQVKFQDGLAIWQGDIVVGTESDFVAGGKGRRNALAVAQTTRLWPIVNGVAQVPYTTAYSPADSGFTAYFQSAVTEFNRVFAGVIQLVPLASLPAPPPADFIKFDFTNTPIASCGGISSIGRIGGEQTLQMSGNPDNCPQAILLHEIGHALGLFHEQARADRDNYVNVNYKAIGRLNYSEFDKRSGTQDVGLYDYGSTMHYGRYLFARDAAIPNMDTIPAGMRLQENGPYSAGDIDAVRRLYGSAPRQVTITSNPPGLQVIVDGATVTTPRAFDWPIGSTHTLDVPRGVQTLEGGVFLFSGTDQGNVNGRWTHLPAGSGSATTVTVTAGDGSPARPATAPAITVYAANFIELISLADLTAAPAEGGRIEVSPDPVTVGGQRYAIAYQPLTIRAVPAVNYRFVEFGPQVRLLSVGYAANPLVLYPQQGTLVMSARFSQRPVTTITSNPPGMRITIDGRIFATPKAFAPPFDLSWTPGSTHTINVAQPTQRRSDYSLTRAEFSNWSHGGAASQTVTLPTDSVTYTANFGVKHGFLVTNADPSCAGTGDPISPSADGYYTSGTRLPIQAVINPPFLFAGWSGDFTGTDNPATVLVDDEKIITPLVSTTGQRLAITSISPATAQVGSGDLVVTINGSGFGTGALVCIANSCLTPAQVVSPTQITATIRAANLAAAGTLALSVRQGNAGCGALSNAASLTVSTGTPTNPTNPTGPGTTNPANSARFVRLDTTTRGNWKGVYGVDGYQVVADAANLPGYVRLTPANNESWTWVASTGDPRALLKAASSFDRLASCWYSAGSFSVELNFSDTTQRQVAVYMLDWDSAGARSQRVEILDPSGAVLDTRTVTGFQGGQYLVYSLSGRVTIRLTNTSQLNAVVGGIFFGGGAAATFVRKDTTTSGSWKGAYGAEGFELPGDQTRVPDYATITATGHDTFLWANITNESKALQRAFGTSRYAACWHTNTSYTIELAFQDAQPHQVALYMVDWDWNGQRSQRVEVLNAATDAVLDTQTVEQFQNGHYLVWNLSGRVKLRVTNLNTASGANAVVSALFFGPGGPAPVVSGQPSGTWQQVDGALVNMSAAADGTILGANADFNLYQRTFQGWVQVPGRAPRVAVSSANRMWASTETALYLNEGAGWVEIPKPSAEVQFNWISAAADGTLMGVAPDGVVWRRDARTGAWSQAATNAVRVAVRNSAEFYLLRSDDTIYRVFAGLEFQLPGLLRDIAVSTSGDLWGVSVSQQVWRWHGTDWTNVPGALVQIVVGNPNTIWGITAAGQTFRRQ